jgi:hypothetical protein
MHPRLADLEVLRVKCGDRRVTMEILPQLSRLRYLHYNFNDFTVAPSLKVFLSSLSPELVSLEGLKLTGNYWTICSEANVDDLASLLERNKRMRYLSVEHGQTFRGTVPLTRMLQATPQLQVLSIKSVDRRGKVERLLPGDWWRLVPHLQKLSIPEFGRKSDIGSRLLLSKHSSRLSPPLF